MSSEYAYGDDLSPSSYNMSPALVTAPARNVSDSTPVQALVLYGEKDLRIVGQR